MAFDFTKPVTSDLRATVLSLIRDYCAAQAKLFDGETLTNTPTGAIRYSLSNQRFERWNGSAWAALALSYLPIAGGTLTGGLIGTTANFTSSLAMNGNAVWHAGNFTPSGKLDVGATAARANGVPTTDPAIGQGSMWVTTTDLIFRDATTTRSVWHTGNFNPASYQPTSTAWNTSNFSPSNYQPLAGAWNTGNFNPSSYAALAGASFTGNVSSTTQFAAPVLATTGAAAALSLQDRTSANSWIVYATGEVLRFYWAATGDRMSISPAGNLAVAGAITAGGDITALSDRSLKEQLRPFQVYADELAEISAYEYRRKDTGALEVGVIAQDARRLVPRAVRDNDDGLLSLDYGRFAAVAVLGLARELLSLKREFARVR